MLLEGEDLPTLNTFLYIYKHGGLVNYTCLHLIFRHFSFELVHSTELFTLPLLDPEM